jgi:hypothetical protein
MLQIVLNLLFSKHQNPLNKNVPCKVEHRCQTHTHTIDCLVMQNMHQNTRHWRKTRARHGQSSNMGSLQRIHTTKGLLQHIHTTGAHTLILHQHSTFTRPSDTACACRTKRPHPTALCAHVTRSKATAFSTLESKCQMMAPPGRR